MFVGFWFIIFYNYGIDPIQGKKVLGWAPNRVKDQHTLDNIMALRDDIVKVKDKGGTYEDGNASNCPQK